MPEKDPIPAPPVRVMCAADGGYAAQLGVMLVSLLIHHAPGRKIEIFVIGTDIPDPHRRKIEASLRSNRPDFDLADLHWLAPNKDLLQGLHTSLHVNLETYSRLLAPFILPEDFDRILYLDSDMVVLSDLSPLYDSPMNDKVLSAVRDMEVGYISGPSGVFNFAELGLPPRAHYFNGGVLLINLKQWREQRVTDRILAYLTLHEDAVHLWDQGGMNAVLHDSWNEIDPVWNQHRGILFPEDRETLGYSKSEWNRVKDHPRIVHYTGPEKPWNKPNNILRLPRYSYFFKYLQKTDYRNAYHGDPLEDILGYKIYFSLWHKVRKLYLFLTGRSKKKSADTSLPKVA